MRVLKEDNRSISQVGTARSSLFADGWELRQMHFAMFVFATAISGALVGSRLRIRLPKHVFVSFFEWFGELGIFCLRLLHSAFTAPYDLLDLSDRRITLTAMDYRRLEDWPAKCRAVVTDNFNHRNTPKNFDVLWLWQGCRS